MKRILFIFVAMVFACATALAAKVETLASPDGRLQLSVTLRGGVPVYSLKRGETAIVNESALGLLLKAPSLSDFCPSITRGPRGVGGGRGLRPTDLWHDRYTHLLRLHLDTALGRGA